ncbi:hypothetical protein [Reyranella sp.]|uniref:hypothetical protein n=1 Tax=Reyranella sp. TaxID=1929291 RepID=UPI0025F3EBA2|nr:hypothetical protein [Reyranella sp.]
MAFAVALCALALPAWAQAWPTKPIRLIAPFARRAAAATAARSLIISQAEYTRDHEPQVPTFLSILHRAGSRA